MHKGSLVALLAGVIVNSVGCFKDKDVEIWCTVDNKKILRDEIMQKKAFVDGSLHEIGAEDAKSYRRRDEDFARFIEVYSGLHVSPDIQTGLTNAVRVYGAAHLMVYLHGSYACGTLGSIKLDLDNPFLLREYQMKLREEMRALDADTDSVITPEELSKVFSQISQISEHMKECDEDR